MLLKNNINIKGWNAQARRGFPGKFESSDLSRDNVSREIGRTFLTPLVQYGLVCFVMSRIAMLRYNSSPLLKNICVRQVVLDKWLPLIGAKRLSTELSLFRWICTGFVSSGLSAAFSD